MIKRVIALMVFCLFPAMANAQYKGETVQIPMVDEGLLWDSNITLEATLYKPEGDGPFPLVIFNHGSTGPGVIPEDMTINPWGFGDYLLKKDIALLIPMRRGRGASGGSYDEQYTCNPKGITEGIEYALESLDATYSYLESQSWVNKEKIVLSGHSRGGMLSLVYASEHPKSAVGVLNFSGGWVSDSCQVKSESANLSMFKNTGQKMQVPSLFIYGHNDPFYADESIEGFAETYKASGGDLTFKFYQLGKKVSGHSVFESYWYLWTGIVDDFLFQQGMMESH